MHERIRRECTRPPLPAWQPWAAITIFAFLLHFVWEFLQVPFFRELPGTPHWEATLICLQATVGDVGITLLAYGGVTLAVHERDWIADPSAGRLGLFIATGLIATAVVELASVHIWYRWAYGPNMPTVLGVGALPLLQWIFIPPAVLWLSRRHLGWLPYGLPSGEDTAS